MATTSTTCPSCGADATLNDGGSVRCNDTGLLMTAEQIAGILESQRLLRLISGGATTAEALAQVRASDPVDVAGDEAIDMIGGQR